MITEFTCGAITANFPQGGIKWAVWVNDTQIGLIEIDGNYIELKEAGTMLNRDSVYEIGIIMDNIKRQYKQLQIQS